MITGRKNDIPRRTASETPGRGVLLIVDYTGRLLLKGVPFLSLQDTKG